MPAISGALPCTASKRPNLGAEIRRRYDAESADEPRAEIGHDVAVQIREQQDVELCGVHHQMHAESVHDPIVERDLRVVSGYRPGGFEE